jgi:hypothetical protein
MCRSCLPQTIPTHGSATGRFSCPPCPPPSAFKRPHLRLGNLIVASHYSSMSTTTIDKDFDIETKLNEISLGNKIKLLGGLVCISCISSLYVFLMIIIGMVAHPTDP